MYSKFELTISDEFFNKNLNEYLKTGETIYNEHRNTTRELLKKFIYENGHIDGTSMKNHWFQMEDVDIFISHSHQDIDKVKAFAGWLHDEFNLTVFIDSCVWGYCDELLKEIDNNCSINEDGETYDYYVRNYTSSHVHIMLATALSEMIDKTECIMFYNTPNSITLATDISTIKEKRDDKLVTLSPWIYHELAMTSLIKETKPLRKMTLLESVLSHKEYSETDAVRIEHEVDEYLKSMISLTGENLGIWEQNYRTLKHTRDESTSLYIIGYENVHPLDALYALFFNSEKEA